MKIINYINKTLESLRNLIKNPVLFVPSIIYLIITTILATILINISAKPLLDIIGSQDQELILATILNLTQSSTDITKIVVSLIIFGITTFFVGASLKSMDLYMYKDVLKTGKASLKKAYKNRNLFFWRIIGIRFTIFLIALVSLGFISILVNFLPIGDSTLYILTTLVLSLIGFYIFLSFFFVNPILALENKGIKETIILSHKYFRSKIKHSIFTLLTIVILFIAFSLAITPISFLINFISSSVSNALTSVYIVLILNYLVSLIRKIWSDLILFFVYKN